LDRGIATYASFRFDDVAPLRMFTMNHTLYVENLALIPNSWLAHGTTLGCEFGGHPGRLNMRSPQYDVALRLSQQDFAEAHNNLGQPTPVCLDGMPDAVRASSRPALIISPIFVMRTNLGNALNSLGTNTGGHGAIPGGITHQTRLCGGAFTASAIPSTLWDEHRGDWPNLRTCCASILTLPKHNNNLGLALSKLDGRTNDAIEQ